MRDDEEWNFRMLPVSNQKPAAAFESQSAE